MEKDFQRLWMNLISTIDKPKAVQTLAEIVVSRHGKAFVLDSEPEAAKLGVEILDYGIANCYLKPAEKNAFFSVLRSLSERHELLPDRMRITERIEVCQPVAAGGLVDVWSGMYGGNRVAIKVARVAPQDDFQKIRKRFYREVVFWKALSHPNILRLVGVQEDMEMGRFAIVSEWMEHGSIMHYIKESHVNRLELLHGAAQGLEYIHESGFPHGNLKGSNILITNHTPPRACLADFGFITTVVSPGQKLSCSSRLEGSTVRFMAPELLMPEKFGKEDSVPTPQADIYAFGLVIFQVLTGNAPFSGVQDSAVGYHALRGKRPARPEDASAIGLSDSIWNFIERCWHGNIGSRPEVAELVTHLENAALNWDRLMPPCIENVTAKSEEPMPGSMDPCGVLRPSRGSDSMEHHRLEMFGPSQNYPLCCDIGGNFQSKNETEPNTSRVKLLMGVVEGLNHIHDLAIIHGNINMTNILVREDGTAHTAGLGNTSIKPPPSDPPTFSRSPLTFPSQVAGILCEKHFRDCVSDLQDDDLAHLVDCLDNALHTLDPSSPTFWTWIHRLGWLCGTRGILPKSCTIADTSLLNTANQPFASGALADMHEGFLSGSRVCVERVRVYSEENPERVKSMVCKGVVMRKHLRHSNIVYCLGASLNPPQFVSTWMSGGGLREYLTGYPEGNSLSLSYDVAQGLEYLHSLGMIHGDLKASNILIDDTGHARVAGLDLIDTTSDVWSIPSFTEGPAVWLAAPEVLGGTITASKPADIYAFGMLAFEVLTGATPFTHIPPTTVAMKILSGERPGRPVHPSLADNLWDLLLGCWDQGPPLRPGISEVVGCFRTALDVQEAHADETCVSTTDDSMSTSSRKREVSYDASSFPTPQSPISQHEGYFFQEFGSISCRLLPFFAPRQPSPVYRTACPEPNGSGDSLYDAKFGEWEKPLDIKHAPSGSHGFLRRAAVWFSDRRARPTQDRADNVQEKRATEEAGVRLLDLIPTTTPGATSKPNNMPPNTVPRERRSCASMKPTMSQHMGFTIGIHCLLTSPLVSCLASCRSNKYTDL